VLVCDDEPIVRILVRAALDREKYIMVVARDGNEALALARSEQPDLILLDVVMPGRSGPNVLDALRRDPGTATTPIVILTAWTQATDGAEMLRAGADGFLTKPFSPHELASLIAELLKDPVAPARAA
jgi:two-component system alkaline phosphatase synthesis response regulator PhoP